MKKSFMPVFLFLLLFAAASAEAQQSIRWGVRVGAVDGEAMIGGEMIRRLGGGFIFNPNFELSGELVSVNADAHYDIEINRDAAFWIGGGIALIMPNEEDLDAGVNLLAGLGTRRGRQVIYAQIKAVAPSSYDSYSSIAVGVRF